MIIHLQDDRAASAAVAAIQPAGSHIFFPVKGDNAVAAVAGFHGDPGFVNEGCGHVAPRYSSNQFVQSQLF